MTAFEADFSQNIELNNDVYFEKFFAMLYRFLVDLGEDLDTICPEFELILSSTFSIHSISTECFKNLLICHNIVLHHLFTASDNLNIVNFIFLSARILENFPQFTDIIESLIFQNFAYGARSAIFSQNGFFEEALNQISAMDQQDEISNDVILISHALTLKKMNETNYNLFLRIGLLKLSKLIINFDFFNILYFLIHF